MHQLNFVASSSNEPFLTVQFAATFCQFRYKVDRNTKQWFLLFLRKVVNSWRSMISDLPCLLLDKKTNALISRRFIINREMSNAPTQAPYQHGILKNQPRSSLWYRIIRQMIYWRLFLYYFFVMIAFCLLQHQQTIKLQASSTVTKDESRILLFDKLSSENLYGVI